MSDFDVVVVPSINETFGITIVEAFALQKMVIASDVGGIPELVRNGETGLLVEPDRPKEAAKAMERILTDAALYQKHRTNGRILVQKRYTWDHITDQVENMLTSISDGRVS